MSGLTHIDADGNAVMVDVGDKASTSRVASAACSVIMQAETIAAISDGNIKKGDVLSIAQLARIMGSKKTADLIPLCHPLALTSSKVELQIDAKRNAVDITATCSCRANWCRNGSSHGCIRRCADGLRHVQGH